MNKLRAAVIGAGHIGRHHIRNYREIETVELVAVADVNQESLKSVNRGHSTKLYTNYRELFDTDKPDLISIAAPTKSHEEIALMAIGRGIHVLIEKPIASTLEEARRIIEYARLNDVTVMVGHTERFNPAITEVKKRLDRQELGKIFQVHARRLGPFPTRVQDVGVILDLAPHDVDVMRYLLGAEIERIFAETARHVHERHEDLLTGVIRFTNGVSGVLDINWLTPTKVRQLSIIGEKGMYLIDYLTQDLYWYKNGNPGEIWDTFTVLRGVREGDMTKVFVEKKEPLFLEIQSFVETILLNKEPLVTGNDGMKALEIAQKLIESGLSHKPILL